jgi:hypothetical protein
MVSAALFAMLLSAGAPEMIIPEGTILAVTLNETVSTGKLEENDPILMTLADDVRSGRQRGAVLIPRGSNVVGRIVRSDRAGHFFGRSHLDLSIQEIITPTGEVYDGLSAKIVEIGKAKGKKGTVKVNGGIHGPVHRQRDTVFLLFPPTTAFQLLSTPKRGPDVVLPVETRLYVKLMNRIYVESPGTPETRAPILLPQTVPPITPGAALRGRDR